MAQAAARSCFTLRRRFAPIHALIATGMGRKKSPACAGLFVAQPTIKLVTIAL